MKDYRELSDQEDDHLGNQDVGFSYGSDVLGVDGPAGVESSQYSRAAPPCEASNNECEDSVLIVEAYPEAGRVLRYNAATHAMFSRTCPDLETEQNQYHPFLTKGDYEVARWAMERGPGQNALTDLLSIDGVRAIGCICIAPLC